MIDNGNINDSLNLSTEVEDFDVIEDSFSESCDILEDSLPDEVNQSAIDAINDSLIRLGFVNFDNPSADNTSSEALVSEDYRKFFKRDVYVGIKDKEQGVDFLGRVVEGPFHNPHEVGIDSAITRTTVLHPDRTQFRPSYFVSGTIEILGQLVDGERLVPTPTRPRPYSEIYIFPPDRLQKFLDINGNFYIGQLMGYDKVDVLVDSNSKNFLPRNIGIFGTVGSGKSNTTQVLIEEAIKAGWAVVAIDVEGEYVQMNMPTSDQRLIPVLKNKFGIDPEGISNFRVYVPQSGHSEAQNPIRFKVPIAELDTYVLSDLMELSEPQIRLLESQIDYARSHATSQATRHPFGTNQASTANHCFTLQSLIDNLDAMRTNNRFPTGILPGTVDALISKLRKFGMSQMLDWNATNGTAELPVMDLLVGGRLSVLDVSETDDKSRNIAIAYTLQALFDRVIQTEVEHDMPNGVKRPKVLVVIEEVHTFVSRSNVSKMRAVLDNLQVISRRGRKRWMSIALVSQQPGHVPDELFELANTRFIHQLKSASNLAPVKQTTGGVHEALWSNMASLGPGQCLVTGAVFKNPLFVEVRPAKSERALTT